MHSLKFAALFLGAVSLHGAVIASSTFDAGTDGWGGISADPGTAGYTQVLNPGVVFQSTGGNPGGFIQLADPDSNETFFVAPSAYLGNILSAIGGLLKFDLFYANTVDYDSFDIVIKGGGTILRYNVTPALVLQTWNSITVPLTPSAAWTVHPSGATATLTDFQTVFANVTDFWILAEFTNGVVETTGLDNVSLQSVDASVPEPSLGAVAGLLAIGLGWAARRR